MNKLRHQHNERKNTKNWKITNKINIYHKKLVDNLIQNETVSEGTIQKEIG